LYHTTGSLHFSIVFSRVYRFLIVKKELLYEATFSMVVRFNLNHYN